jgi:D-xylose transport system substrate-binding protein
MGGDRIGTRISGRIVRVIVACLFAGGLTAACATSNVSPDRTSAGPSPTAAPSPTGASTANAQGCLVGAAWLSEAVESFGIWEGPALQKAILGSGRSYKAMDALGVPQNQVNDIDALVAAGAKVIVTDPGDPAMILPAVQRATSVGIMVLTLGQPVDDPKAVTIAFDPVETGRMEARALLAVKPRGKYVIATFDPRMPNDVDPFVDPFAVGAMEILQPAVDRGDIAVVARLNPPRWDLGSVDMAMPDIFSRNGGRVDAVVTEKDDIAVEVQASIDAAGLTGIAVGGVYDGGGTGFYRVARGTWAVDVWGNPELLGAAAARAAITRCSNPGSNTVDGSAPVTWPLHGPLPTILLTPVAVTQDNIDVVIKSGSLWRNLVCDYLDPSNAPPSCQLGAASPTAG